MQHNIYRFNGSKELSILIKAVSPDNILIYTINSANYPIIESYKNILRGFASKIDIIDANNIPISKTIQILKENKPVSKKNC